MEVPITTALKALKMPGMAESWRVMEETHQLDKLSVRDGMPLLLQAEIDSRETNRIAKLIKSAGFRLTATIEELDIDAARGVPADHMRVARLEGKELRFFEKLTRYDLIILDDFGMKPIEGQFQNDFEQILDDRYNKKALIIASQLPVSDWYALFKNELIAEACLDRIIHKAIRFQLKGESLRKKY